MKQPKYLNDKILTAQEVKDYLKLPLSTVYELVAKGKIPAVKCGRQWRFLAADIHAFLRGSQYASKNRLPKTNERRTQTRALSLFHSAMYVVGSDPKELLRKGVLRNLTQSGCLFIGYQDHFDELGRRKIKSLEIGDFVEVAMEFPGDARRSVLIEGRIVYLLCNGKEAIGIQFHSPLLALQKLLQEEDHPTDR